MEYSNCCTAPPYENTDLCSACSEHADFRDDEIRYVLCNGVNFELYEDDFIVSCSACRESLQVNLEQIVEQCQSCMEMIDITYCDKLAFSEED